MSRLARPFLLGGLIAASVAAFGGHASAQVPYVIQPGRTVVVTPVTPASPVYVEQGRRFARRPGRYVTRRPVYPGRTGISFAPYTDRYYPNPSTPGTYVIPARPR